MRGIKNHEHQGKRIVAKGSEKGENKKCRIPNSKFEAETKANVGGRDKVEKEVPVLVVPSLQVLRKESEHVHHAPPNPFTLGDYVSQRRAMRRDREKAGRSVVQGHGKARGPTLESWENLQISRDLNMGFRPRPARTGPGSDSCSVVRSSMKRNGTKSFDFIDRKNSFLIRKWDGTKK